MTLLAQHAGLTSPELAFSGNTLTWPACSTACLCYNDMGVIHFSWNNRPVGFERRLNWLNSTFGTFLLNSFEMHPDDISRMFSISFNQKEQE
jgi:hypothetical protein